MRFLNLGPFRDTTTVHISVEDVDEPPVFEPSFYFVEVPEDVEIGTTIQIISAKDPDVTNNSIRSVLSLCVPPEHSLVHPFDELVAGLKQDRWEGLFSQPVVVISCFNQTRSHTMRGLVATGEAKQEFTFLFSVVWRTSAPSNADRPWQGTRKNKAQTFAGTTWTQNLTALLRICCSTEGKVMSLPLVSPPSVSKPLLCATCLCQQLKSTATFGVVWMHADKYAWATELYSVWSIL